MILNHSDLILNNLVSVSSDGVHQPHNDEDDESDDNGPQKCLPVIDLSGTASRAISLLDPCRVDGDEDQPDDQNKNNEDEEPPCNVSSGMVSIVSMLSMLSVVLVPSTVISGIHSGSSAHARGHRSQPFTGSSHDVLTTFSKN